MLRRTPDAISLHKIPWQTATELHWSTTIFHSHCHCFSSTHLPVFNILTVCTVGILIRLRLLKFNCWSYQVRYMDLRLWRQFLIVDFDTSKPKILSFGVWFASPTILCVLNYSSCAAIHLPPTFYFNRNICTLGSREFDSGMEIGTSNHECSEENGQTPRKPR